MAGPPSSRAASGIVVTAQQDVEIAAAVEQAQDDAPLPRQRGRPPSRAGDSQSCVGRGGYPPRLPPSRHSERAICEPAHSQTGYLSTGPPCGLPRRPCDLPMMQVPGIKGLRSYPV